MTTPLPTLDVLICTKNAEGLARVCRMIPARHEGIRYVVSAQGVDDAGECSEAEGLNRPDVELTCPRGIGLSRNRNHALRFVKSDLFLLADDDERFLPAELDQVRRTMGQHAHVDIALFRCRDYEGHPIKRYPATAMSYRSAQREGYYVSSVEMAMRRRVADCGLRFDERFGLGAAFLCAGEEDVFLHDANRKGLRIWFFPQDVGSTESHTTGLRFATDVAVQRSKGAAFSYCYGLPLALVRTLREGASFLLRRHQNPFPLMRHMTQGIAYERHTRNSEEPMPEE